ncbi:MAG: hypothetical protein CL607_04705 [Anaerolineaceae bacterium]|nr:hypothetical protein [Anaerolineaceae bacterium]
MFKHFRILVMAVMVMAFVGVVAAQEDEGLTLETITGTDEYYGQTVTLEGHVREFISPRIFVLSEGAALDDDAVLVVNLSSNIDTNIYKGAQASVSGTVQPSLSYIEDNDMATPMYDIDIVPAETMGETDMSGGMEAVPDDMETLTPEGTDMEPTVEGMEPTAEAMDATPEATMESTDDMDTTDDMSDDMSNDMSHSMMNPQDVISLVYSSELPEEYDVYTVVFVTDGASINWLPQPE